MRPAARLLPLSVLLLGACAAIPPRGPSVVALPPEGKPLATLQGEDAACRSYAYGQIGVVPAEAISVAAPVPPGSLAAAPPAPPADLNRESTYNLQRRFDAAYAQCMASSGNQVVPLPSGYGGYYGGGYYAPGLYGPGLYPGYYGPGFYGPGIGIGIGLGFYGRGYYGYRGGHYGGFHGGFGGRGRR